MQFLFSLISRGDQLATVSTQDGFVFLLSSPQCSSLREGTSCFCGEVSRKRYEKFWQKLKRFGPLAVAVILWFPSNQAFKVHWKPHSRCAPTIFKLHVNNLSDPTATEILSRYAATLHSVALRFPVFGGVSQENRAPPPQRPCSTYLFSSQSGCHILSCLLEGVAVQGGVVATASPVGLQWATFFPCAMLTRGFRPGFASAACEGPCYPCALLGQPWALQWCRTAGLSHTMAVNFKSALGTPVVVMVAALPCGSIEANTPLDVIKLQASILRQVATASPLWCSYPEVSHHCRRFTPWHLVVIVAGMVDHHVSPESCSHNKFARERAAALTTQRWSHNKFAWERAEWWTTQRWGKLAWERAAGWTTQRWCSSKRERAARWSTQHSINSGPLSEQLLHSHCQPNLSAPNHGIARPG